MSSLLSRPGTVITKIACTSQWQFFIMWAGKTRLCLSVNTAYAVPFFAPSALARLSLCNYSGYIFSTYSVVIRAKNMLHLRIKSSVNVALNRRHVATMVLILDRGWVSFQSDIVKMLCVDICNTFKWQIEQLLSRIKKMLSLLRSL
jgi:RNase P subunit RPR2